ncbi:tape measure protein [Hymenobacter properus]|uniref:Tape measure protein n=1 Tax=Hymenobacter properus TaxID=2791026 RepID=A0A931FIJ1_9BACT|nr:tape measure protein [Hymenobacter properus]MBF9140848.1 tape measure protein [Hymenobacter properus]MBR7719657.1 tape measure protein [Microvirga sp. SRT04]
MPEVSAGDLRLDLTQYLADLDKAGAAAGKLLDTVQAAGDATTAKFSQAAQAQVQFSNQLANATAEARNAQAATRSAADEVRRLSDANRELAAAQKGLGSTSAEYLRLKGLIAENTQKIKEAKFAIDENKRATEAERAAVQAVRDARREEANQTKLVTAAAKDAAAAAKQESIEVKAVAAAQREAATAAKESNAESAGGSGGGFFGGLLNKLPGLGAGLFSVGAIIDKIKEKVTQGLDDYAALSGIQNTFKAIAGSASEGAREYAFVKQRANELGLELTSTARAYTGLYAAAKESNFSVATTRDLYVGLTAAGKVLDRSQEEIRSSLVAVEQMISKGTVSSQELKLQLGNALPGAFGLAAKAAGLTTEAFTKQLATGKILASDFLPKFAAVLKEKYVNSTEDAAAGVRSNLGRINTAFQESSAKIGAFLAPAVKYVADFVSSTKRASEVTAEEQVKLEESLVAITSLNVGNSERTRLIKELQAEYPAFLGNIDAEKVSNEQLSTAIDKVSESLVNKILIQKEDEKIADQAKKTADALYKRTAAQVEITKQLAALNLERQRNINSSNGVRAINDNGSVGFGIDFRKENQGLPVDVAGQNTVDLIAQRKVAISTLSPAYERLFAAVKAYREAQVVLNTEEDKGNELTRQKALFMQALGISTAASTGALNGNAAALTKSIDALQAHRKEISDQMQALKTNDYNDGPYRAKLAAFKADLDKTDKLINELLGKQDKAAISQQKKQESLLAAYLREQQTYKELALKASEAQADDAKSASERQFQLDLTNIYEASRKLKAAKKAAGKGGELDSVQTEQENILLQGAYDAHYKRLLSIQRTYQDQQLSLAKDGDEKQLKQLDLNFEREQEKYANQAGLKKDSQLKYERERAKLLFDQEQKRLDEQQALDLAVAESAALDFTDPVKAEEVRQQGVYAVKLKYALLEVELKKRIRDNDPTTNTEKAVKDAQNAVDALQATRNKAKPFDLYRYILGKADSPELRKALDETAANVAGFYREMLQTQQQAAAQRANDATTAISELQNQLTQELQYREEGSAANVAATRAAIAEQRQIRKDALAEQREAAQAQVLLDTVTQAGNLITAISNIFAGTSKLDLLLPGAGIAAGITLSSLLVGAFAASKVAAYNQASNIGKGYFNGGFTPEGGKYEEAGTVHKGEFVANQELTRDYRPLFKALHEGQPQHIDWSDPKLAALLPDHTLPGKLREERQASIEHHYRLSMEPLQAKFDEMETRLASIDATNKRMAERWDTHPTETGFMKIDPETNSIHRINA